MQRASQLKRKEVINLCTSEKLGFITDFEICTTTGEIAAIIISRKPKDLLCAKHPKKRIPWKNVNTIGNEIILVNIPDCE